MFSNELICNVLDYINQNIFEEIKIDAISKQFHYDKTYIMKRFKKELGISIINYSNIIRIYNSLKYFKDNKSILEIALKSGFNSQEYYNEMFKNTLGVSPLIYKKYIKYISEINNDDLEIINNKLLEVEMILNRVNKYKNNRKPKTTVMVKKLSTYKSI